ncbi:MAG: hypothetical protein CMJ93_04515 [Planctomycetes bacterium]|nr:hypothetical protein [Planctomycetota bacterium]
MRIKYITTTVVCALLGVAATQAYIRITLGGKTLNWSSNTISYNIHTAGSDDISDNSHIPAIEHAFQSWSDVSGSNINLVRGADTASGSTGGSGHTITFDETNSSGFFPSGSGIVAITPISYMLADGRITDADILFNGNQFAFSTDQTPGTFDVQDVLTHEVGHFIGLDHSPVVSGTMWPYVSQTQWLHRSLSQDDEAGAIAVATGSGQTKVTGTIRKPGSTSGLAGAIVSASLTDGRFIASTTTNSNGNFTLRGMPAGDYYIHIDPLEGGMSSANLTSNSSISTAFAPTFYGGFDNPTLFSLTPGAQLSCGVLTANNDIAMYESASSTTLLQQGTSSLVTIYGSSIPVGATMVAKTNELIISNITSNSSYVRATITANSAAMVASYNLYIKAPNGDFETAPGVVEVIQPAPNLAAVSQFKVSTAGGETITLSGTNFQDGAFVLFGGYESDEVTFIDSNTLSVVTPAVPLSLVDVAVHNPDGQQAVLSEGIAFTGQAVFTQSWPTRGQSTGGTHVFINGDNFNEVSKFYIDGQQVAFTFKSAKIVHLQMPAHALGAVELTIENPASPDLVVSDFFEFVSTSDPSISNFTPRKGPKGGGTIVDLFGGGFEGVTEVWFGVDPVTGLGGKMASATSIVSAAELKATTANNSASGNYALKIITASGQGAVMGGFTFEGSNLRGGGEGFDIPGGCSVNFEREQQADFRVLIPQYLLTIVGWLILRNRLAKRRKKVGVKLD